MEGGEGNKCFYISLCNDHIMIGIMHNVEASNGTSVASVVCFNELHYARNVLLHTQFFSMATIRLY